MKKLSRTLSIILALTLCGVGAVLDAVAADSYGSNGKFLVPIDPPATDSIPISKRAELEAIQYNLSGTYHLTRDIDLSGAEWAPIGDGSNPFTGVFDGQGHSIKNLRITENALVVIPGQDLGVSGLFGFAANAEMKNVGLDSVSININLDADDPATFNIGALVGKFYSGSISNCYVSGKTNVIGGKYANYLYIGGLVGHSGYVDSFRYLQFDGVSIADTYSQSDISVDGYYYSACVGGVASYLAIDTQSGSQPLNEIVDSHNTGNISINCVPDGKNVRITAGGISGGIDGNIVSCHNTGNISAAASDTVDVGGITSSVYRGSISKSCNTGNITGVSDGAAAFVRNGGIAALSEDSSVTDCYNTGNLSGGVSGSHSYSIIGGIVASHDAANRDTAIARCYNAGDITNTVSSNLENNSYTGGLAGISSGARIENNFVLANKISSNAMYTSVIAKIGVSSTKTDNFVLAGIIGILSDYDADGSINLAEATSKTVYKDQGWDFDNVWAIPEGGGFPILRHIKTTPCPGNFTVEYYMDSISGEGYLGSLAGVTIYPVGRRLTPANVKADMEKKVAGSWLDYKKPSTHGVALVSYPTLSNGENVVKVLYLPVNK